jgi:cell division protein FtsQ
MKFINWQNIRLLLMISLVIFLYSFTSSRNSERKLKKSEVIFVGQNNDFIKQETVNKLLIENKSDVRSIAKEDLNLNKLEKSINQHPMVEKSDVFVTVDGILKVKVKQKTPVARVFDGLSSFYVDYEGNIMPLSEINTARVPLILGEVNKKNKKKLAQILKIIYDDEFLKKNIIGVQILPSDNLIMTNRNFDYQIEFGKMVNEKIKFKNYKAFFQKAVLDSTLYKYKKINLRFTQQVVCSK